MTATATTSRPGDTLTFEATDVTGSRTLPVEVQPDVPAEAVASSVASLLSLPTDVPWALRDDQSSAFLVDDAPIGEQLAPGAQVTVTPKTHLGAHA